MAAKDFEAGVCGGSWWNSSMFVTAGDSSRCCTGLNGYGSYGWVTPDNLLDNPKAQNSDSGSGEDSLLIDSNLQMMGFGLSSSPTSDWNDPSFGKGEGNFDSSLQEQTMGFNSQIRKDWNFYTLPSSSSSTLSQHNFSTNPFKHIHHQDLLTDDPINYGQLGSTSYGYSSTLLQSLLESDPQTHQSDLFNDESANFSSATNYGMKSNDLSSPWVCSPKPSLPKQQHMSAGLKFSNDHTPFSWNTSTTAIDDIRVGAGARLISRSSSQSQCLASIMEEKSKCYNINKLNEDVKESTSAFVKSGRTEPVLKRQRIEAPSPLPTFKVRKEKLGDRVTALQQLVSPFGKTDTASVLHEAIGYIKLLHDQVNVLSTPYLKSGSSIQHQQGSGKSKNPEGPKQDLRSRGLCVVPISSTYQFVNENTTDFWMPTFGGTFR